MNRIEREKMIRAMDFVIKKVIDEEISIYWLDDIEHEDLNYLDNFDERHIDNEHFGDLMADFLRIMSGAWNNGGLYCDGVASFDRTDYR